MISICAAAYNNLEYLKILYKSIQKNTKVKWELIIHDNGSRDGTKEWLEENNIDFVYSEQNEGFCAVNKAAAKAKYPFLYFVNCDMYLLPGWDIEILKQINKFKKQGVENYSISSCMIEGYGNNPEYTIVYFGHDYQTFNENGLLQEFTKMKGVWKKPNTIQWSHPILLSKKLFEEVGGFDTGYFPGWNCDNDLGAKLYSFGAKFVMLGNSRVYHFISKGFRQLPPKVQAQSGEELFRKKWGVLTEEFRKMVNIAQPYEE